MPRTPNKFINHRRKNNQWQEILDEGEELQEAENEARQEFEAAQIEKQQKEEELEAWNQASQLLEESAPYGGDRSPTKSRIH